MSRKTLNPTERSLEIRQFAEDLVGCIYIGDVSSTGENGRHGLTSIFRKNHTPGTMTIPQELNGSAQILLRDIEEGGREYADMPRIMDNLRHAVASLQTAYNLVSSDLCAVREESHRRAIKGSYECSIGEFEQVIAKIQTFDR